MMDCFMLYLRKNSKRLAFIFIFIFMSNYAYALATKIKISNIQLTYDSGHYFLSYSKLIPMSSEARLALDKGIPFYFLSTINLSQQNIYGLKKKKLSKKLYVKLKYKSLLRKYMVTDNNNKINYFNNIDEAIKKLSNIEKFDIGRSDKIDKGEIEIKIMLDKKYLPKAMQINPNDESWTIESDSVKFDISD